MYMGPIVAAETPVRLRAATSARPRSSGFARIVTGVPVLALAALVIVPWLITHTLVAGMVLAVRALPGAPRALLGAIDYAGSVALGR